MGKHNLIENEGRLEFLEDIRTKDRDVARDLLKIMKDLADGANVNSLAGCSLASDRIADLHKMMTDLYHGRLSYYHSEPVPENE